MKIYKQIIATGHEWRPCVHCGKRFEFGEIITALMDDNGNGCSYWNCAECFERFWFAPLPPPVERDDDLCLVVIEDGKVQTFPKRMGPAEYMVRKAGKPRMNADRKTIGNEKCG